MSFVGDMVKGVFGKGGPDYAGQAKSAEKKRQKAITQGTAAINQSFSGFDPSFYQQRQNAYIGYAMPQLAQQYRDTAAPLGFNLANRNLIGSSVGRRQWGDLSRTMAQGQQQIGDTAISQSQELQRAIQEQQNKLLANLYASADPAQAQQQALAVASQFSGPSTFAPVANSFSNLINQYVANQALNAYRPQTAVQTISPYANLYGGGLPSPYMSVTNR